MTAKNIRIEFKKADDIRDKGLTTPNDVQRCDDIVYGIDKKWQSLDVYRPKNAKHRQLPVIVSVHGGAWVYGDKERYQYYCMSLAQKGFSVINFSYRLAPENKFPASLEDTNSVFKWVFSNAEQYGFDVNSIFAVGDSAGAHILSLYCCICSNPEYALRYDTLPPNGFMPKAIALNCGVYEMDENATDRLNDVLPEGFTQDDIGKMNVLKNITSDFPPTFLMTSSGDFLKDQAHKLAWTLTEKNVPFVFRYYGTAENLLPHVFHCDLHSPDAKQCNNEECEFFKEFVQT